MAGPTAIFKRHANLDIGIRIEAVVGIRSIAGLNSNVLL
jgi:hypothetical protein